MLYTYMLLPTEFSDEAARHISAYRSLPAYVRRHRFARQHCSWHCTTT